MASAATASTETPHPVRGWSPRRRSTGAVLLVDVLNDFAHEDGDRLCRSYLERFEGLGWLVAWARDAGLPVAYANDSLPATRCTRDAIVAAAVTGRLGDLCARIAPHDGDVFVIKPLYSGFEQTPLEPALRRLGVEELIVAGAASERCVAQTVTSARERGFDCLVAADACATVDERLESIAFDYLAEVAEARIVTTRELCDPPRRPTQRTAPSEPAAVRRPLAAAIGRQNLGFTSRSRGYAPLTSSEGREARSMTSYQSQEQRDRDAQDAVERTKDKARDAAQETEDKARNIADRVHDTVEDAIPGDSDHDGH